MGTYPAKLIEQAILEGGTEFDFEEFGVFLYEAIEGIRYVPTSRNYDFGADGRARDERREGTSFIISSLQEGRLVDKVERDIKRLKARREKVAAVRICYAYLRTEKQRLEVESVAKKMLPHCRSVEAAGIVELVHEAGNHASAFERVYQAQIDEVNRQLAMPDREDQDAIQRGLRVILAAQLSNDAERLRVELLTDLILQAARSDTWLSRSDLAREVSNQIGLSQLVQSTYLTPVLKHLVSTETLEELNSEFYRKRAVTNQMLHKTGERAASRALEGLGSIKRALIHSLEEEKLEVSARALNPVILRIQNGLVDIFRKYGAEFVGFVHRIAYERSDDTFDMPATVAAGLERIAHSIIHLEKVDAPRQALLAIAKRLPEVLFHEKSGARDWVGHLCVSYVAACSLGLHPDAFKRIEVRLKSWDVIPDTHVLLSLLGKGEDDHSAIITLAETWTKCGGKFFGAQAAMNEVIRHARLAEKIVEAWVKQVQRVRGNRFPDLPSGNVFLRDAAARSNGSPTPSTVNHCIQRLFVGISDSTGKLEKILADDFRIIALPNFSIDRNFFEAVLEKVRKQRIAEDYRSAFERENAEQRCLTDANLLLEFAAYRKSLKGSDRQAIILTHAVGLEALCHEHLDKFGYGPLFIDPDRLLFTSSLLPSATFTMKSVQQALFDSNFQRAVRMNKELARKVTADLATFADDEYIAEMKEQVDKNLTGGLSFKKRF